MEDQPSEDGEMSEPLVKTFTFVVDEEPALAGVDPFNLLIDRLPEDNLKKPTKKISN